MKRTILCTLFLLFICTLLPVHLYSENFKLTRVGEWGSAGFEDVFIQGNYAYCAAVYSGLSVFDIGDPASPVQVGACETPGVATSVFVHGTWAYLGADDAGLQVIDIGNPHAPVLVGSDETPDRARGIYVSGNHAYLAAEQGIYIYDISTPSAPVQTALYDALGATGEDVFVKENYAYAATGRFSRDAENKRLVILDIENPAAPTLETEAGTKLTGSYRGIHVHGDYAFLSTSSGLEVFNVSDTSEPTRVAEVAAASDEDQGYGVYITGNYAYLAKGEDGLQVFDISIPTSPAWVGQYTTPRLAKGVHVSGERAVLADAYGGMTVIDVSDPSQLTPLGRFDAQVYIGNLAIHGNLAFLTQGYFSGVISLDISNPAAPRFLGSVNAGIKAGTVKTDGRYVYVDVAHYEKLRIYDAHNPSMLQFMGTFADEFRLHFGEMQFAGDYLYLPRAVSGVALVDVSNRTAPRRRGSFKDGDIPVYDVYVQGRYAYVLVNDPWSPYSNNDDRRSGVQAADVSNPDAPVLMGQCLVEDNDVGDIYAWGDYVYVTALKNGLLVFDVSNPAKPVLVSRVEMENTAYLVCGAGKYIYVSDYRDKITALDASNPGNPAVSYVYPISAQAVDMTARGDYLYVATASGGKLVILKVEEVFKPRIDVSRNSIRIPRVIGDDNGFMISNGGTGSLPWELSVDKRWVNCSQVYGNDGDWVYVRLEKYEVPVFSPGIYTAKITITSPGATNSPKVVKVTYSKPPRSYETRVALPPAALRGPLRGERQGEAPPGPPIRGDWQRQFKRERTREKRRNI